MTCPNCGFVHDYVRGRCPKCGLQNIPDGKPPSGCARIGMGCFFFPIGAIGSCIALSSTPGPWSGFVLIGSLVGGILAVWAADNYVFFKAETNAKAKEIQLEAIRKERERTDGLGSQAPAGDEKEQSPPEGADNP